MVVHPYLKSTQNNRSFGQMTQCNNGRLNNNTLNTAQQQAFIEMFRQQQHAHLGVWIFKNIFFATFL